MRAEASPEFMADALEVRLGALPAPRMLSACVHVRALLSRAAAGATSTRSHRESGRTIYSSGTLSFVAHQTLNSRCDELHDRGACCNAMRLPWICLCSSKKLACHPCHPCGSNS